MYWLAAALAGSAAPLAPSGQWIVSYEPNTCILQRDFGTGADKVTFAIRPFPVPTLHEIALVGADLGGSMARRGTARLTIHPSEESIKVASTVHRLVKRKQQVSVFDVEDKLVAALGTSRSIEVQAGGKSVTIAPTGTAKALKALDACQEDLRKSWGISRETMALATTPAKADNPETWIVNDDYPADAVRSRAEGTTAMLWTIGVDGRVHDCRILRSSGHQILDDAACKALTKRGRYTPALDKDGKPVESWSSRLVRWILPV